MQNQELLNRAILPINEIINSTKLLRRQQLTNNVVMLFPFSFFLFNFISNNEKTNRSYLLLGLFCIIILISFFLELKKRKKAKQLYTQIENKDYQSKEDLIQARDLAIELENIYFKIPKWSILYFLFLSFVISYIFMKPIFWKDISSVSLYFLVSLGISAILFYQLDITLKKTNTTCTVQI